MLLETFQNYHIHSCDSNIFTADSAITKEDYAKRAVELGHTILSSCEHGFQGRYYDTYDLAQKYKLKFIFGTEAYWVKDRFEKDRTNSHICIFAKNETGRKAINRILSDANIDGYYYKPRVDINLLLSLPPNDIFITTACIAFWKYDDIENIVLTLHNHFRDNFMFEVQYHNTQAQKSLNRQIKALSLKYKIPMIMGCDSHFIYPEQAQGREDVLEAKNIHYDEEDGWYMDYPDTKTAFNRFKEQAILSDEDIENAINNTSIFLTFEDITFDKSIKLPTLYPDYTQEQKDNLYKKIIMERWKEFATDIPKELHDLYKNEIKKEVKCVVNTHMSDYFLIDHELVKEAISNGGIITNTGRGSGVSFITNTLLGFSKVDRISAPVKLYPERFMSETRILQTKSLPDLDLNCGTPDIFAQAQTKILGENHAYPMIAYGTFKRLSAFKLYAKSQNLNFTVANEISSQLEDYMNDLKHAEEDEKDTINVYDYVEERYHDILQGSEKYMGITSDRKPHPCGHLIYQGNIKEDIGLILCKSESTQKEVLTTVIDGAVAEKYKFLKNDLLKVDVVLIIDKIYKRIGIKPHTVNELLKVIKNNDKVWDIYANGYTIGINQVEKPSTTKKVKAYKPRNISELTAFIAAIRPSFQSMYSIFESRKPFSYGIPSFDNIIQTDEMPNSFVLYQEQTMATLQYAGFPADETYGIIKAIAKKHPEIINPLKERFVNGFTQKILDNELICNEDAIEMSNRVWKIIEDSSGYGFNASHAYSYALDSVYCAYLKSHYPMQFYEVMLQTYADKKDKEKVALLKQEMQFAFGIQMGDLKFGEDNRGFIADTENNKVNQSLLGIKFLNQQIANDLYELGKNHYDNFIDLLYNIKELKSIDSRQLEILITLNYFDKFAYNAKLLKFKSYFDKLADAKTIKKDSWSKFELPEYIIANNSKQTDKTYKEINNKTLLHNVWDIIENKKIKIVDQAKKEIEYLDYIILKEPQSSGSYYLVTFMKYYKSKLKPTVTLYNIKTGETEIMKITSERLFAEMKFHEFSIINVRSTQLERKNVLIDGKWKKSETEYNTVLTDWIVV